MDVEAAAAQGPISSRMTPPRSDPPTRADSGNSLAAAPWTPTHCSECLMTWLAFGDGAICLYHQEPVHWTGPR